jgi:hypothetical protein
MNAPLHPGVDAPTRFDATRVRLLKLRIAPEVGVVHGVETILGVMPLDIETEAADAR